MDGSDDSSNGQHGVGLPARVQVPLELSPRAHRRLAQWCRALATDLEVRAVPLGDVLETMIDLALTDPHTANAVRARLARTSPPRKL